MDAMNDTKELKYIHDVVNKQYQTFRNTEDGSQTIGNKQYMPTQ